MAITIEGLKVKLEGLKQQLQQLQNNANAVNGAIMLLDQLIKEELEAEALTLKNPEVKE
jgi:hypothetical protein